jgi:hypothetical protein
MDFLGQILAAGIVLAGGVAASVCLLAALNLLLPGMVEPIRRHLEAGLLRPFLVGLAALIGVGGTAAALLASLDLVEMPAAVSVPIGILFGLTWLLLAGFAILTIYGLAALAAVLGQRQVVVRSPFRDVLGGGLLLFLASLAPIAGWILFTPFVICCSLGASLMALFRRKPHRQGPFLATPPAP